MVTNVLYGAEEKATEESARLLGENQIPFSVARWSPDDPERRDTVYLVSSVGEFCGLEAIHLYVDHYREFQRLAFKKIFNSCAAKWLKETRHCATIFESTEHPAFQKILCMGEAVIPLILNHLQKEPEHWFWALASITKENPAEGAGGNVEAIRNAWLGWGKDRGLI